MSKITFRADEDLIERLEALEASKSEVMREALRAYLDGGERRGTPRSDADRGSAALADPTLDEALAARVDRLIAERLDARRGADARDVNVNVTFEGRSADAASVSRGEARRKTGGGAASTPSERGRDGRKTCDRCGESMADEHVHCPNCGEKAVNRAFCECGDEIRSDWSFCPGCGRRTPAADVLDRS